MNQASPFRVTECDGRCYSQGEENRRASGVVGLAIPGVTGVVTQEEGEGPATPRPPGEAASHPRTQAGELTLLLPTEGVKPGLGFVSQGAVRHETGPGLGEGKGTPAGFRVARNDKQRATRNQTGFTGPWIRYRSPPAAP
jgi:hypothetical protein